ncbi:MAG: endonuclease/exonuclease/phosphatase family protein [Marmoricola sp.]
MLRPPRRWWEPALVAAITVALAAAFWAAWQRTDGPPHHGDRVVDARGLGIPGQEATVGPPSPSPTAPSPATRPSATPTGPLGHLKRHAAALSRLRAAAEQHSHDLSRPPLSSFTFAEFNTLGASHTAPGGDKADRAPGSVRGASVGRLFLQHGVDVAAVQEFQRPQAQAFAGAVGDVYDAWPGLAGSPEDGENSVVWRRDRFEALETRSVEHPYFQGHPRRYPVVLLRDRQSGARFWVTSFHNPADTKRFGNQARWRGDSLGREIAEIGALLRSTGQPVIVAGDMNDREAFFCPFARGTGMHAASGGSSTAAGCSVPVRWIDWIMGSPAVAFAGYAQDRSAAVAQTSDHPLVLTGVTVTGDVSDRSPD